MGVDVELDDAQVSSNPAAGKPSLMHGVLQVLLFVLLLVSNVGQRVFFKLLGYVLGSYPDFILLSVSGAFVITLAAICGAIVILTGGWLPETRTWRATGAFAAIGFCNAVQGFGMVLANPHVPGSLQAQLQQAVIPFTLLASWLLLGAFVTRRQCGGVLLMVAGICLQLQATGDSGAASSARGELWPLLFLFAQLPVALAAILQEKAFQAVPVNVFQMMLNASCVQFLVLLLLLPFYAAPSDTSGGVLRAFIGSLEERMGEAWQTIEEWEAGGILLGFIVCMLVAQLSQALMVKYSSATFTVLCMVIVVPLSSVVFALPPIMGSRAEKLPGATPYAIVLVFLGIVLYRFGNVTAGPEKEGFLEALLTPQVSFEKDDEPSKGPTMMASGVGIIQSEYTAGRQSSVSIWEEGTKSEAMRSHPAPAH